MSILEIQNISKNYDATRALNDVSLMADAGELHAIVGENGAGKSTLMRILSGAVIPDRGEIRVDNQKIEVFTPQNAYKLGIRTVYQEFSQVPHISVAENILLGKMPYWKVGWLVDWKKVYSQSREILSNLGFPDIDVKARICDLNVSQQQVVEIAKAITENPKILILDEPSAVLAEQELTQLFIIIEDLKKKGTLILYISHRLDEVFKIADNITVLKDGEKVRTLPVKATDEKSLINLMVGRPLSNLFPTRESNVGKTKLVVENLTKKSKFSGITFDLKEGEILGMFGLVGSGRTDLAKAIFGAAPPDSGTIILDGKVLNIPTPQEGVRKGIAYLTKDRKVDGLVLPCSIKSNMTYAILNEISTGVFLNLFKENEKVSRMVERMSIKPSNYNQSVRTQSGGNQQKVLLSRWLLTSSKVLILNEPTRGVDVNTKAEIYKLIVELAAERLSIIMISSELPEIIGLSDRALVLRNGEIAGEFNKEQMSEVLLLACASGVEMNLEAEKVILPEEKQK